MFSTNSTAAYSAALKYKWLNAICSHMASPGKIKGYWTKDKCAEEAQLYNNKSNFNKFHKEMAWEASKSLHRQCRHIVFAKL